MVPPPPPLFTKVRKAAAAVLVSGGLLASIIGFAAERIDPVASLPSRVSCSDPSHDLALAQATKVNPVFELDRYAPAVATRLGLLNDQVRPVDQTCSQDRANVISMVEQMIASGVLKDNSRQSYK